MARKGTVKIGKNVPIRTYGKDALRQSLRGRIGVVNLRKEGKNAAFTQGLSMLKYQFWSRATNLQEVI